MQSPKMNFPIVVVLKKRLTLLARTPTAIRGAAYKPQLSKAKVVYLI